MPALPADPPRHVARVERTSAAAASQPLLPSSLVSDVGRRLFITMLLVAFGYLVMTLLYLTVWAEHAFAVAQVLGWSTIVVSVGLGLYCRRCDSARGLVTAGLAYEVLVCFVLALTDYWELPSFDQPPSGVSWTCVLIVFFPLLIPTRPRTTLVVALLAASMSPLAFYLAVPLRDQPMPGGDLVASLFIPPYMCAILAYVPARVLNRLGAAVDRARRLGAYELVERLGAGGMGEVWRARHRMLIRPAAVKLIRPDALGAADDAARRRVLDRFEREAQTTASLASPHTVELYDFGVSDEGALYYVMELIHGVDLETLMRRFGPLKPERVVHLLLQVCDSLDEAHAFGLVHRDIKPANIVVGRHGMKLDFVKVLDFGLVRAAHRTAAEDADAALLTRDGEIAGTPAYAAPEQVIGDGAIDGRVDLYALGCVAYWLLTGALVFDEDTPLKVAIAHATQQPAPLGARSELKIPAALEALVMACLEKDPAARPQSAAELAERLAALELAARWTPERAARWWQKNLPDIAQHPHLAAG